MEGRRGKGRGETEGRKRGNEGGRKRTAPIKKLVTVLAG